MAPTEGYHGTNGGVSCTIEEVSGCFLTPRLPQTTPFFGIWHPFGTSFWVHDTRKTPELGAKVIPKNGSIFDKVPTPEKGVRISISAGVVNPADVCSRGCGISDLLTDDSWQCGRHGYGGPQIS